jgi:hypothetical protein
MAVIHLTLDWYFSLSTSRSNRLFLDFPYSLQFNSGVVISSTLQLFPFRFTILNQPHLLVYTILSFLIGVILLNCPRIITYSFTPCSSILHTYEPCFAHSRLSRYLRSGRVAFVTPLVSLPLTFVQKYTIHFISLPLILTFTNSPLPLQGQFISFRDLH